MYHISGKFVILIWQFVEIFFNCQTVNSQTANNISRGHCGSTVSLINLPN